MSKAHADEDTIVEHSFLADIQIPRTNFFSGIMPSRPELMKLYADVRQQNEYQIVLIALRK